MITTIFLRILLGVVALTGLLAFSAGGHARDYLKGERPQQRGYSGGDIVKTYESLRPKGFEAMPADFRELGPSYRAANPAGVNAWLELEHKAVISNPFRQRAANVITEETLKRLPMPTLLITGEAHPDGGGANP